MRSPSCCFRCVIWCCSPHCTNTQTVFVFFFILSFAMIFNVRYIPHHSVARSLWLFRPFFDSWQMQSIHFLVETLQRFRSKTLMTPPPKKNKHKTSLAPKNGMSEINLITASQHIQIFRKFATNEEEIA